MANIGNKAVNVDALKYVKDTIDLSKAGYLEIQNGILSLYSDSTKKKKLAATTIPSVGGDGSSINLSEYYTKLEIDSTKTSKRRIDFDGTSFKLNGLTLNYKQLYDYHLTTPDFTFVVYGDRAYLLSYVQDGTGMKEMRFQSVIAVADSIGISNVKTSGIYATSSDGVNIASVRIVDINSENTAYKATEIKDSNANDVWYPSVKAVKNYFASKEDLAQTKKEVSDLKERFDKLPQGGGTGTISPAQIESAVNKYLSEHPVQGVTPAQIATAVQTYLEEHPVEGGVTEEYVTQVVNQFATGALQQVGEMLESYPTIAQADARYALKGEGGTSSNASVPYFSVSTFEKIGFIGDSYTAGAIHRPMPDGSDEYHGNMFNLSWATVMARKNGVEAKIFAKSGISTRTYIDAENCLPKLINDAIEDPCGLYWFGLGLNDVTLYNSNHDYIGNANDCDTTIRTDTFYGNCGWIVRKIKEIVPDAKIIVASIVGTRPTSQTQGDIAINTALEGVANHFGLPFIELRNDSFYLSDFYVNQLFGKHPTTVGHSGMACANERLIEDCVKNNLSYFVDYIYPVDSISPPDDGDDPYESNIVYELAEKEFNGTSDYVDTGLKLYENTSKDFTITCDFDIKDEAQYQAVLIHCFQEFTPAHGIEVFANSNSVVKRYAVMNTTNKTSFDFGAQNNQKIVLMRKDGKHYAYRNGSNDPFYTFEEDVATHTYSLFIGARNYRGTSVDRFWRGTVHSLTVYDCAISDKRIRSFLQ